MARGSARARVSSTPSRIVVDGRAPLCPALAYSPPPYRPTPSKGYTRRRLTPRDFYFPFFHARAYVCIRIPRRGRCLRHRISLFPRSARSVAAALSLRCLSLSSVNFPPRASLSSRVEFYFSPCLCARPARVCQAEYVIDSIFQAPDTSEAVYAGRISFLWGKREKKDGATLLAYIYTTRGV